MTLQPLLPGVPTMSGLGMAVLIAAMVLVGFLILRRKDRSTDER